jgi:sterol carrier protein 2
MAKESGEKALKDAGVSYNQIEQAFVGYVYGDSTSGQAALYGLGLTGIPIFNVNNNCSTGSSALLLAKNAIENGESQCCLALGFEKMQRGSLSSQFSDRMNPMQKHVEHMSTLHDIEASPMTAQMFGNAGRDYMKKYNIPQDDDVFARIAHKNHKHSVNNPYAQFRTEYSLDEIKNSTLIHAPLTKLQCSPTSDGSACVILASEQFVRKHKLEGQAIEVLALEMATDLKSTFSEDCMKLVGYDMTQLAAKKAFTKSGIKPEDVQVVELHDCFSCNELITYEALGLCAPGKAVDLVRTNNNTYGGKYVINPSGGLISKGHPLGATGLAQCSELTWQLRGHAEKRQVPNVKYALQHNIGLGGAAIVGIYTLGFPNVASKSAQQQPSASTSSSLKDALSQHKSGVFFSEIEAKLEKEGAEFCKKINATIGFDIKCNNGKVSSYIVDMKNAPGSVKVNDGSNLKYLNKSFFLLNLKSCKN